MSHAEGYGEGVLLRAMEPVAVWKRWRSKGILFTLVQDRAPRWGTQVRCGVLLSYA